MPHDLAVLADSATPALIADDLDLARTLVREELSENTRGGYRRDVRLFTRWCDDRGVCALPAAPTTVAAYIGSLVAQGSIRAGTLGRRLAGIGWAHKIAGEEDPTKGAAVRAALRGARRRLGTAPVNRRRPISPDMLVAMAATCPDSLTGQRDRAILLIGWSCALRRSEIVGLDVADIEQAGDGVRLCIRRSKTDQLAIGQYIGLPDRGSKDRIKPIVALRTWLKMARIREGAVFRRINKSDRLQDRLDGGSVNTIVRHYAAASGFDTHLIGAHSLRTGFATAAAEAGATLPAMQAVTRHTDPATLLGYIRMQNLVQNYPRQILR